MNIYEKLATAIRAVKPQPPDTYVGEPYEQYLIAHSTWARTLGAMRYTLANEYADFDPRKFEREAGVAQ